MISTGRAALVTAMLLFPSSALAATLQVGPGKTYATPCQAIAAAAPGDLIEVDAAGSYDGDVCAWSKSGLTIRGVGGRAKIDAAGKNSQGKAIWVIAGDDTVIENIELSGAKVPDMNGAGIRQEGKNLTVRGCYFHDNEDGILAGDKDGSEILIEGSEFANNGAGDGQSHNFYINHVAKFTLRYSWSHAAKVGHLVKSRAAVNHIEYNRLTVEATADTSYEVNLPNGGKAFLIGNLIEQGPNSQNGTIIDFGSEGSVAGSALYVVNNTVVNNRSAGGTFVRLAADVATPALLRNNVFAGPGTICNQASAVLDHNFSMGDPTLADPATYDYHLLPGSPCIDAGADPGTAEGVSLTPQYQYVHPAGFEKRTSVGTIDIGAYELGGGGTGGGGTGGGASSSTGSNGNSSSSSGAGGGATTGGGDGGNGGNGGGGAGGGDGGGCSCHTGATGALGGGAAWIALGLLGMARRRNRKRGH